MVEHQQQSSNHHIAVQRFLVAWRLHGEIVGPTG